MKVEKERQMPPNQKPIKGILRWGIDHPGIVKELPKINREKWVLTIDGQIKHPLKLRWLDFLKMPQTRIVSDFHCVEGWSVLDCVWEGVLFITIMALVKPNMDGRYVWFECADGYTTSLTIEDLNHDDVILAHKLNDEDLPPPLGGPVRLVVPQKYAYKSPMWITRITFMEDKRLGYWESGIYSDSADIWKNDRYRK
ncbi:molybdopterin-dependent oxidoreductase [Candidatus Bathyarchaeota archaeon]|nr:molybdopterin-dependent oxidoreductase [Candidatus Bathyarchaeota archaeon]